MLLWSFSCLSAFAQNAERKYEFAIDEETVGDALDAIVQETGYIILFPYELAERTGVNPVQGQYTVKEALDILFRGTEFSGGLTENGGMYVSLSGADDANKPEGEMANTRVKKSLLAGVATFLFGAGGAHAQGVDTDPAAGDDVIVVTATKRNNQTLVDAPAGISVISGSDIEDLGADSLRDFLEFVPAVSIDQTIRGGTQIQIRGVNAQTGAASVGFYMDDLPFSFINLNSMPDPSPYDLERVEVLRGPQGTLYGAGTAGGVVLVKTHDPVLGEFSGKSDFSFGMTKGGDPAYSASAALNMPLGGDKVALRGAISYQHNGGWIEDTLNPDADELNDEKRLNARLKLLAQLTDNFSVNLSATVSRIDREFSSDVADDSGAHPISMFDFAALGQDTTGKEDYEQFGSVLTYDAPWFTVRNATTYINYDAPGAALFPIPIPSTFGAETFANELRVNSNHDGPLSWLAGFYYRDARQTLFQDASFLGLTFNADDVTDSTQYSVFGDATLSLFDGKVDIGAGVSYFSDETENVGNLAPDVPDPVISNVDSDLVSPQASIAFHPVENATLYARYAEGFRAGIIDFSLSTYFAQFSVPSVTGIVDAEKIKAYELGAKGFLIDEMLYADVALFFNKTKDSQQSANFIDPTLDVAVTTILNAGLAESKGVEWTFRLAPNDRFDMFVAGAYVDAGVAEDFYPEGADPATADPVFEKGDPIYLVPDLVISGGLDYSAPVGSDLTAIFSANAQYSSERPLTQLVGPPVLGDELFRANARVELAAENWSVYAFFDNITNEQGAVTPNNNTGAFLGAGAPIDGQLASRYRPRTIGVGVRARF